MKIYSVDERNALKGFNNYLRDKGSLHALINYNYNYIIDEGNGEFVADLMEEGIRDGDEITIPISKVVRNFKTMNAYILTSEYEEYEQKGEYFIAWFHKKPSLDELQQVMISKDEKDSRELCCHILDGGGRRKLSDYQWYHLREVPSENFIAQPLPTEL